MGKKLLLAIIDLIVIVGSFYSMLMYFSSDEIIDKVEYGFSIVIAMIFLTRK